MSIEKKINFTKLALQALAAPESGRATFHDSKVSGLQIRITSSGLKTFSIYRRVRGGPPTRITIGRFPEVTIEQARQKAMCYASEMAQGTDVAAEQRKARQAETFGQLFTQYLERHSKPHKRTWKEDESKYAQYLANPLGRKRLPEVTRKDVAEIHSRITLDGHAVTANRVLALISSVYGWAISVDLSESNPAIGVKRNPERSRDRFIQGAELPYFFLALKAEPNECLRDFFLMSLLTGARRTNMLEMAWQDVSLDEAQWKIPRTKNGDNQYVMLAPEAMGILLRRRALGDSKYVFPGNGATGHVVDPKKAWHRMLQRMAGLGIIASLADRFNRTGDERNKCIVEFLAAEHVDKPLEQLCKQAVQAGLHIPSPVLPDIRIHDLRRTLASWQVKTGATLPVIGKTLNHRSSATTAVYARMDNDPVRVAVTRATEEMLKVGGARAF
jgi:integrase